VKMGTRMKLLRHVVSVLALALVLTPLACERSASTTPEDGTPDAPAADGASDDDTSEAPAADAPQHKLSHTEYVLEIDGSVTKAQVDDVIAAKLNEIRACYDDALRHPDVAELHGAVVVGFAVSKSGEVGSAALELSEFAYPPTEKCLVALVGTFAFPKQKAASTVKLPFYMNVL
jgi:hypothetical protein